MSFASLCVFTDMHPVSFLSKCHRKKLQRSSCGSNILPQRSPCAFIMQLQRSSCCFQDSSSSNLQSAVRRTSACGREKKFLHVHFFGLYCITGMLKRTAWTSDAPVMFETETHRNSCQICLCPGLAACSGCGFLVSGDWAWRHNSPCKIP